MFQLEVLQVTPDHTDKMSASLVRESTSSWLCN